MEVRQLRYFVLAAELEHFGAAAERLHIVQPAVSKQIASMECELGLTLFDRTHRRATLTADGRAFLPHARRALQAIERAARPRPTSPTARRGSCASPAAKDSAPACTPSSPATGPATRRPPSN